MYKYQLSQDNPEGIDFVIDLESNSLYTSKEFAKLMEEIICYTFNEMLLDTSKTVFKSYLDDEILVKNLKLYGFVPSNDIPVARYCYSPFGDGFESQKLTDMINRLEIIIN